tara:strand:+ start:69 stop:593 length:525 start_codon:yes stop_codon:yes gene_type:complete
MRNIEIFKDIPKWEGIYQVSNLGNVKSLARKWSPRESTLTPAVSHDKYLKVDLKANGKREQVEVNRLVALAFLDSNYVAKGLVCDHKDRDRQNNDLSNLRVVTKRENSQNTCNSKNLIGASKRPTSDRWASAIQINGKTRHIGDFDTAEEASTAYFAMANLERKLTGCCQYENR